MWDDSIYITTLTVTGDTVIDDISYYVLKDTSDEIQSIRRVDTLDYIVYDFDQNNSTEYPIYWLNASVGDTLPNGFYCSSNPFGTVFGVGAYYKTFFDDMGSTGWEVYKLATGFGLVFRDLESFGNYCYTELTAAEIDGIVYGGFVTIEEDQDVIAQSFSLYQNYPNPFNSTTTIRFDLPEVADVELVIYDILGQKVETLVNEKLVSGEHEVIWSASELSSGIYFGRMQLVDESQTRKLLLQK